MFSFVDLFAGIGGFHQAMVNLGGTCVFASEIDPYAIETYRQNYQMDSAHDITKVNANDTGNYDFLCAGFPCQPFSKAGERLGFMNKTKGTLFFEIQRILKDTKPKYLILENVKNILTHDHGNTIRVIKTVLDELGYHVEIVVLSPHLLGIPQFRERVFIMGVRKDVKSDPLQFDIPNQVSELSIYDSDILEKDVEEKYYISEHEENVLTCWNDFYLGIQEKVIGFPVWSSEFKASYDLSTLPKWKKSICEKNRKLYTNNQVFIDEWLIKYNDLNEFTSTEKKFEWQAGDSISSIWDGIIQFRPSGVRVKRPNYFPALVALVQIPIVGRYKRRLTPREAARLQSFSDSFIINENEHQAYKQFGNSVNVKCVEYLARQLFDQCE